MSLDGAGQRANQQDLNNRARWNGFWRAVWRVIVLVVSRIPIVLVYGFAVGVTLSATGFDWFMSSRGWLNLLPGLGFVAWLGAAGAVGFWYFGVYRAMSAWMAKDVRETAIWAAVAAAGYLICVSGVGLATLTNTSNAKAVAEASRKELAGLKSELSGLEGDLEINPVAMFEANLDRDTRKLKALIATAYGSFDMPDLDVDGTCAKKLSFNQRRMCAQANGGVDEATGNNVEGLRFEVTRDQNGLKAASEKAAKAAELRDKVKHFTVKTGDATQRALSDFFGGESEGNAAMLVLTAVLAALFLFAGGFFTDWLLRKFLKGN